MIKNNYCCICNNITSTCSNSKRYIQDDNKSLKGSMMRNKDNREKRTAAKIIYNNKKIISL